MAVASSLFRSEGVKREERRQQCSGGDGGRGQSFAAGRSTLQSPAAHPAAAASIKMQLSLQRPGEGSIHASAEERGTLVTWVMDFAFKSKNQYSCIQISFLSPLKKEGNSKIWVAVGKFII